MSTTSETSYSDIVEATTGYFFADLFREETAELTESLDQLSVNTPSKSAPVVPLV